MITDKILNSVNKDKLMHAIVCYFICLLGTSFLSHKLNSPYLIYGIPITITIVVGVLKEVGDRCNGKVFDYRDIIADVIGMILGTLTYIFI